MQIIYYESKGNDFYSCHCRIILLEEMNSISIIDTDTHLELCFRAQFSLVLRTCHLILREERYECCVKGG